MAVRRWVWVVGGVAIVLAFLGIAAAIVGVGWVTSHTQVAAATSASAADAFKAVHDEFGGQPPLIEVRDDTPQVSDARAARPPSTTRLTSFHVLVWAPRDDKLVRVELPFWLLRIKSAPIEFGDYASGLGNTRITMTAEELERYGPGILLDLQPAKGERILIWVK